MSDCPQFEDLLSEENAGHTTKCPKCRDLLDALAHVDAAFDAAFGGVCTSPELQAALNARIARTTREDRVTMIPEILDLIGWAAALATAAVAISYFTSTITSLTAGMCLG